MSQVEQQIWIGVAILIIVAIVVGAFKSLISNAQRSLTLLQSGQKDICDQVQHIAVALAAFDGQMRGSMQWHEMHKAEDERQFASLNEQTKEIRQMLGDAPCKK